MSDVPDPIDFPEQLVGQRVVVRPFRDEDAPALYDAIHESMDRIRPWLPWYDKHRSIGDTHKFIQGTQTEWLLRDSFAMGLFLRSDGALLGGCGLAARNWKVPAFEIGYWLRTTAEGKGYMSEAVRLVTACSFEVLRARRVMIHCDSRNQRSKAIPERLGYKHEGCLRNAEVDTTGQPIDALLFSMIPEDFQRARRSW